jgi:hypothetical protein
MGGNLLFRQAHIEFVAAHPLRFALLRSHAVILRSATPMSRKWRHPIFWIDGHSI